MDFNLIGVEKKEYKDNKYPTKYYLHVAEFPHVINVSENIYNDCVKGNLSVITFPRLEVTAYEGKYYYKYDNK